MGLQERAKPYRFAQVVSVFAVFMLPLSAAEAASCSALKSELSRLQATSTAQSPAAKKWSSAKKQQQKAIAAASRDARHFGCSSSSSAKCRDLNGKIKRMNTNLAAIERQLAKSGGGASASNAKRLRQVRAALKRQSCNSPANSRQAEARKPSNTEKPKSFLSRLFNPNGVEQVSATTGDKEISAVRSQRRTGSSRRRLPAGGAFRTLCVRTCDGYFFPVSFSTGRSQFVNDEARCSEICPASPTELYVYRNPGGDQSQMTSLAGVPYADQPFAFRYKSEFVEGCSCRVTQQSKLRSAWSELGTSSANRVFFADISAGLPRRTQQPSLGGTYEHDRAAPSPLSRPPLQKVQLPQYDDPGTLLNLEKGFDVTAVLALAAARTEKATGQIAANDQTENGFPLLSIRARTEGNETAASPVFKTEDPGFRPAPERSAPVRVVGPEYFVAQ